MNPKHCRCPARNLFPVHSLFVQWRSNETHLYYLLVLLFSATGLSSLKAKSSLSFVFDYWWPNFFSVRRMLPLFYQALQFVGCHSSKITKRDVNRGLWLIIWNGGLSKASTLALLMHDQPNKLTTMVIISNSKHKQAKGSLHWNIEFILPFYLLSKWLRRSIIGVKLLLWVINSFCIYDYVFMISNINVLF